MLLLSVMANRKIIRFAIQLILIEDEGGSDTFWHTTTLDEDAREWPAMDDNVHLIP